MTLNKVTAGKNFFIELEGVGRQKGKNICFSVGKAKVSVIELLK